MVTNLKAHQLSSLDTDVTWIKLPPRKILPWHSISFQYGAGVVAAAHCGLQKVPSHEIGQWQHGWIPSAHQIHPEFVVPYSSCGGKIWVARRDEEEFLQKCKCDARAIGLPIIYTNETPSLLRRSRSLLFLPPHSSTVGKETWKEDELAEHIRSLTPYFDQVVACVHSHCIKMGNWVNTFKKYGIPVVSGGDHQDVNSLQRMRDLFQQFEFVSTNQFGSAIAYASAFGAKVSVSGPFVTVNPEKYRWSDYYQDHPGAIEKLAALISKSELQRRWPNLFVPPHQAKQNIKWGKHEIGWDCKLSPGELKSAFGWDLVSLQTRSWKARAKSVVQRSVPKPIRVWVHKKRAGPDSLDEKWAAIKADPSLKTIILGGQTFHFSDPESFRGTYVNIFELNFYRIPVVVERPTIIDCGANIGLATRYWLEKYPRAHIIAFEPDPDIFAVLKMNCDEVLDAHVELHCAAVWSENTTLAFRSTGNETGAVQAPEDSPSDESISVKAIDLSDYLGQRVDFLKLDIEGSECDVLPSLHGKLGTVQAMYIEFHSYDDAPQRLAGIFQTLEANGFRYSVNTSFASKQPMRTIESSYGMDIRLDIWAWK